MEPLPDRVRVRAARSYTLAPTQVLPPPVAGAVRLETRLVAAAPPMDEAELALRFRAEVSK